MTSIRSLLNGDGPLILPGAHDALSARVIEDAGFKGYGIGGSALSAVQLALPDLGLQSFGEYRDAVRRIVEASSLPVMVDGENGFGDPKAVTRTVRTFEAMGVSALALEDLVFPPVLGQPPAVIPLPEMTLKLETALRARVSDELFLIGRTDAAQTGDLGEAILRLRRYEAIGVDGGVVTGVTDPEALARVRAAVQMPMVALVLEGLPGALSADALWRLGFQVVLHPANLLLRVAKALREGAAAIRAQDLEMAPAEYAQLGATLRASAWAEIDAHRPS